MLLALPPGSFDTRVYPSLASLSLVPPLFPKPPRRLMSSSLSQTLSKD